MSNGRCDLCYLGPREVRPVWLRRSPRRPGRWVRACESCIAQWGPELQEEAQK